MIYVIFIATPSIHSSSLDGYIRIPDLVQKVGEHGQTAIALTDHGTMSGVLDLYKACEKYNANPTQKSRHIKPILGMEAYIVNDRTTKVKGEFNKHLLLHARNKQGYQNLLKLHYEGYATGATFVYDRIVPRIDHTLLTKESCKGLIATTGCLASEFARLLIPHKKKVKDENDEVVEIQTEEDWDSAINLAEKYKALFDHLFAEIQPSHLLGDAQADYNEKIIRLAEICDLPIICTTDSHYLTEEERDEHQLVLAIQSKKSIDDPDRFTFEATPLLSTGEMCEIFDDKIIENTQKIADLCEYPDYLKFDSHGYRMPKFPIPETDEYRKYLEENRKDLEGESDSYRYCTFLVEKNWPTKLKQAAHHPDLERKYRDRLNLELDVIKNMGFIDYFLIVGDFVNEAKSKGILTGDGRGSVGGCLLSYLLGITKLDPLKYDLLFSRFLNKDRISMPDIDMDFDKVRRDEIKTYLAEKYGQDRVASIATFSRMKVRACIKDVVRSLRPTGDAKSSFELADRINKILEGESDDLSYDEALTIPAFKEQMDKHPDLARYVQKFEGLIRQTGIHAAGVIIGSEPLTDTIPLMVDKNGVVATAYDGVTLENDGFLKMDLLGLKNLTIITDTLHNIEKTRGQKFKGFYTKGMAVSLDEPEHVFEKNLEQASPGVQQASKAYRLLREGKTNGVFQVEKEGMRGLLKSVYVNSIEEIAAVLALFRPGPLGSGMTAEYGERKRSGEDLDEWYLHPSLKPVLGRTYGVLVYQEQVMQIAVQCAGFSESEADTLRKAIGKKIGSLLRGFQERFTNGCIKTAGMSPAIAKKLWEDVFNFASYGFCAAHATGYAHVTYKTAYLKANYPAEFFGALLSNEENQVKLNSYLREAQNQGIKILPVHINKSTMRYEVEDANTIRRDLTSLKGVGAAAVEDILEKRPFKSMTDFLGRTNSRRVTSRVIETLIKAGAFDEAFKEEDEDVSRKGYYDFYADCRKKIKRYQKKHESLLASQEKEVESLTTRYKKGLLSRRDLEQQVQECRDEIERCKREQECFEGFPRYDWTNPVNVRAKGRGKQRVEVATPVQRYTKDPRTEWTPSEIVQFESEIYGVPVTYNTFDFHEAAERAFRRKCDTIYTFDQSLDQYQDGDEVYIMVYLKGILKKSPYRKDPSKYMRRFLVEDRTNEGLVTVFDRTFSDNITVWKNKNTIIAKCKVNVFMNRKSLVVDRVIHNCGSIDGSM